MKPSKKMLETAFPVAYVEQGLNGTRAYKSLKDTKEKKVNDKVAGVMATRLLAKVSVQQRILALLPSEKVEAGVIRKALSGDITREINWTERHKYLETSLKLKGLLNNTQAQGNTNIGIIIER